MTDEATLDGICVYSEEMEQALIGSAIINPMVLYDVKSIVAPDDFYFLKHNLIWAVLLALHGRHEAIDLLTIIEVLRSREELETIGGSAYLTYLQTVVPTGMNAETHARMVFWMAQRRRWVDFASAVAQLAAQANIPMASMTTTINERYRDITMRSRARSMVGGHRLLSEIWDDFSYRIDHPAEVRGLSTGIDSLDRLTMGLRPGLYAIGGASSMGKSTFGGGLVRSLASQVPGIYVPTEVQGKKALEKIATDMAGLPYKQYLSGILSDQSIDHFSRAFSELSSVADNLTILDSEQPSVFDIEAEVMRSEAKWLLIDSGTAMAYQNMEARSGKKQSDLRSGTTWLCQQLQNIARSGVIVIALWQTGRNAKDRSSKIPRINDFKEAGAIEETADVCLALYRHDYYVARKEADADPMFPPGTATVFILKDRDGGNGDEQVVLGFRPGRGFTAPVNPRLVNLTI